MDEILLLCLNNIVTLALKGLTRAYSVCGLRVQLHAISPALAHDLKRLDELWNEGLPDLDAMRAWYDAALQETWRDRAHEQELLDAGVVIKDLRTPLC
jgi:glutathione S-transferase